MPATKYVLAMAALRASIGHIGSLNEREWVTFTRPNQYPYEKMLDTRVHRIT